MPQKDSHICLTSVYLVSTDRPLWPIAFLTDPFGNADGCDPAWLRYNDVAVGVKAGMVVEDVLSHLCRLARARRPLYHRHLAALYRGDHLHQHRPIVYVIHTNVWFRNASIKHKYIYM